MVHGTGIPVNLADSNTQCSVLNGPPILVQIESITDIGISAYDLNKVRETRKERLAAGEREEGEGDIEVEGEGPIPTYPRSMLRFEISDGVTTIKAMEYRSIPELSLEETQLGCKLLIQNVEIRRGIAFLDPQHVTVKGHMIPEREANRFAEFARGLRQRMGIPEPDPPQEPQLPPPSDPVVNVRSPLRSISPPPPLFLPDPHNHSDDEDQPRRRRVPTQSSVSSTVKPPSTSTTSTFFDNVPSGSSSGELSKSLPLSPSRSGPIIIDSDEDDYTSWLANNWARPIKPLPARGRTSLSSAASPPAPQPSGKGKSNEDDYLDIDDDDDEMFQNSDFLADLDAVEMAALQMAGPASLVSSTTSHTQSSTTGKTVTEVITIEDDEEDDKENSRPTARHVRRRTMSRPSNPDDVIDISD
ncbi:hypothetical protein D9758_003659 [Tetrapyrgos nigripes]|uniref:RecQ-mediated genome instability protein 1 n=1 Tax=Tetrapyrgos nigripes TaxID=182062 RepID=A0A8H5GM06_9AGAR|nr:hypothetical protein D9758_003659 [Tetrapyrgos nigripes]